MFFQSKGFYLSQKLSPQFPISEENQPYIWYRCNYLSKSRNQIGMSFYGHESACCYNQKTIVFDPEFLSFLYPVDLSFLKAFNVDSIVNIIKLRFFANSRLYVRLDTAFCQRNNFICELCRKSFKPYKKTGSYLTKILFEDITMGRIYAYKNLLLNFDASVVSRK